jgi:hypothetical protein
MIFFELSVEKISGLLRFIGILEFTEISRTFLEFFWNFSEFFL